MKKRDQIQWYFVKDNKDVEGPVPQDVLIGYIEDGLVHTETLLWNEELDYWTTLSEAEAKNLFAQKNDNNIDEEKNAPKQSIDNHNPDDWHVFIEQKDSGPLTIEHIQKLANDNQINLDSYVWKQGYKEWIKLSDSPLASEIYIKKASIEKRDETASRWYYEQKKKQHGPVDKEYIIEALKEGLLTENDLIQKEGSKNWHLIGNTPFKKYIPEESKEELAIGQRAKALNQSATTSSLQPKSAATANQSIAQLRQESSGHSGTNGASALTLIFFVIFAMVFFSIFKEQSDRNAEELEAMRNDTQEEEYEDYEDEQEWANEQIEQLRENQPDLYQCRTVVNIRTGPGINYEDIGDMRVNEYVWISETVESDGGTYLWGKRYQDGYYVCIREGDTWYLGQIDMDQ